MRGHTRGVKWVSLMPLVGLSAAAARDYRLSEAVVIRSASHSDKGSVPGPWA
jgi:hypothetical protein